MHILVDFTHALLKYFVKLIFFLSNIDKKSFTDKKNKYLRT